MKKVFYVLASMLICISMLISCESGNNANNGITERPQVTTDQHTTTNQPTVKNTIEWMKSLLIFDTSQHIDDLDNLGITVQTRFSFEEFRNLDKVILNRLLRNESNYIEKVYAVGQLADVCGYDAFSININTQFRPHVAELFNVFHSDPKEDSDNNSYYPIWLDSCGFSYHLSWPEELTQEELDLIEKWNDFLEYAENNKERLQTEQLPYKYIFIRDFEISKDDFIKLNNLDIEYGTRRDEVIEVLFSGDIDRIKRELSYEDVYFSNGTLYKASEIDQEEFEQLIMNNSDFIPYLERCAISSTPSSDDYDQLIKYYVQYMDASDN